jgi:hypothetical protein
MIAQRLLLATGLLIAIWLAFYNDDSSPVSDLSRAAITTRQQSMPTRDVESTQSRTGIKGAPNPSEPVIISLQSRDSLIRETPVKESRLFGSKDWAPALPPVIQTPPPPAAPALPFTYLGKKLEDGRWEVYLSRGEQTYIVRDNSMMDGLYRVDSINPPTMHVVYLPLNLSQTIAIGGIQ